jgi:hypothetical protein
MPSYHFCITYSSIVHLSQFAMQVLHLVLENCPIRQDEALAVSNLQFLEF